MRNTIYIIVILLFTAGYAHSKTSKNGSITSLGEDPVKETNNQKSSALQFKSKVDSIDYVNNQIIISDGEKGFNKAFIILSDSAIFLTTNKTLDHRIFGFAEPSKKSKRLLLLSIFTSDVETNPFNCELGAYYDTSGMQNMKIKYISRSKDFIKALVIETNTGKHTTIFFERKCVEFMK